MWINPRFDPRLFAIQGLSIVQKPDISEQKRRETERTREEWRERERNGERRERNFWANFGTTFIHVNPFKD